MTTNSNPLTK
jgi:cilla- and flagella-associated protein